MFCLEPENILEKSFLFGAKSPDLPSITVHIMVGHVHVCMTGRASATCGPQALLGASAIERADAPLSLPQVKVCADLPRQ